VTPKQGLSFVRRHGIVLQAARGPVPSLAEAIAGRVTYVHRRLWAPLVKLAARFGKAGLARVWNEHTATGAHRSRREAFPRWVPAEVTEEAERMSIADAERMLAPWLSRPSSRA
jgi:hypothetical protein